MPKYRLNPININSITEFGRVRGNRAGEIRNTYMVKFTGANANTNKEINELRKYLESEMKQGRIYYKYLDSPDIKSDCMEQKRAYEAFISTCHFDTALVRQNNISEDELIEAVKEMQKLLQKYKKNISDTIEKNIMVKLLYLLENNFSDIKINGDKNIKVVAENIQKESEIYFFIFLNLLGMDVCLLQYSKDISVPDEYYYTKKLGDFYDGKMIYEPDETTQNHQTQQPADTGANGMNAAPVNTGGERKTVTISLESTRRKDRDSKTKAVSVSPAVAPVNNQPNTGTRSSGSAQIPAVNVSRDRELSYVELARLSTSIVMIAVFDNRKKLLGTGSGIMIGRDGFILTNNHVIRGGYYFEVRIEDDERIYETNEVIKYHNHLDLAIIRISRVLNPLRLYSGKESLVRGQKVVAIGSPLGLFNSVSDGIISGFRNIDNVDMIQFSAPTSPGSSGGAVLNMYGEVIGISTSGFSEGQNINLAVPYDAVYNFTKSFIR